MPSSGHSGHWIRSYNLPWNAFGFCMGLYHLLIESLGATWNSILLFWVSWILHGNISFFWILRYWVEHYHPLPDVLTTSWGYIAHFQLQKVVHGKFPFTLGCFGYCIRSYHILLASVNTACLIFVLSRYFVSSMINYHPIFAFFDTTSKSIVLLWEQQALHLPDTQIHICK